MFFNQFGIKSRNINLIGLSHLIVGFIFFIPILALYLERDLFSITNVAIIFAIQSITMAVLEIPTGAIADLFGRKSTFVVGHGLYLVGLIFLYVGGNMFMFVLYAIITAIGSSLMSGNDVSIIYDTLKEENKEKHYKKLMSILYSLWPLGAIIGSIAGGYFAKFSLELPILLSFIPLGTSFILSLFLEEPKYHKEEYKSISKQMWNSTKTVFRNKQVLFLMVVGLIFMAFGETAHNLKPLFFEFKGIPIEYFGIVFAFVFGFSSLGHYLSHYISEKIGNKNTLILSAVTFPLFLFLATLVSGILSMVLIIVTSIPFGLRNPVMEHMLHAEIDSSKRATVFSINNLLVSVGMAIGGPMLGYFADFWSINIAYMLAAALMSTAVIFLFFVKEKE